MLRKRITFVLAGLMLATVLSACEKKGGEGPAERAGKEVDKLADQIGKKVDETADKARESTKK